MNEDQHQKVQSLSWWKVAIMYIGLMFTVTLLISLINRDSTFYNLAAGIIVSWIISLVVYYVWAIHFYNVNMGWTDYDWQKLEKKKREQPDAIENEPEENPNASETLGLPPGTVRATIALTLLVGSLALMLASLEMPYKLEQNSFFIDNYEFIKTAFLMMVAFYFGNKSLEFLKDRNPIYGPKTTQSIPENTRVETLDSPVRSIETILPEKPRESTETQDDKNTADFDDKGAQG